MNNVITATLGVAIFSAMASTAAATTVTVSMDAETTYQTTLGIRADTGSRGIDLAGTQVTANFADGSIESLTWIAFDPYTTGGVEGANIDIFMDYRGFNLDARSLLTSLSFDTFASGSLFDATTADEGTPGNTPTSAFGFPVRFVGAATTSYFGTDLAIGETIADPDGTVTASYSGAVGLNGAAALGDLYTSLMLDFSSLTAGGILGRVNFDSDIDTLADISDLRAVDVPSAVPLPAGLPLLLGGLASIGILRRRKLRG